MKSIHTLEQECLQRLLRAVRSEAGFTQKALAEELGLPQSFVSKYESGERLLDVLEIRRICKVLKIDLAAFIRRLEKEISNAS
jgi:transcriptional regulator with XRE-family HTH domain